MYWFKTDAERLYKSADYSDCKRFINVIKGDGFYRVVFVKENDKYYIIFQNQPRRSAKLVLYKYFGLCVTKEQGNEIYKRLRDSMTKNYYYRFPDIDDLK